MTAGEERRANAGKERRANAGLVVLTLIAAGVGACASAPAGGAEGETPVAGPRVVQAGAPGEASRATTAAELAARGRPQHTPADVHFMQGMIAHHLQAVEMTEMVQERTSSEAVRMLAGRIEASQADEILQMRSWLESRGEIVPDAHAHHAGAHAGMPGMLTREQLARLRASRGAAFDRIFLESMIQHHEGALVMVQELFAADGGREVEIYQFASHVDADQRMEIDRMRRILGTLQQQDSN
ncbi:DUF305 domain-containing protein [soil metagenome]